MVLAPPPALRKSPALPALPLAHPAGINLAHEKSAVSGCGRTMSTYRLIAAEASYYSGKVRAYLRYKGVPFEELLATRKLYQELPVFQGGVRSIPVLLTPEGDALTD